MPKFSLLILCAGMGTRMLDLTKNTPKPLLQFNDKILLGNTINFFRDIGCNEFFINTHYLHYKIENYINKNFNNILINLIYEPLILGTGGGVRNIFNYTKNENICVVNSDIFWKKNNKLDIKNFLKDYKDITHCKVLLSKKNNFLGLKNEKGDFTIQNGKVSKLMEKKEAFFYSGLQIVSKKIFDKKNKIFPINQIWSNLIIEENLRGSLLNSNIIHVGDKSSFDAL